MVALILFAAVAVSFSLIAVRKAAAVSNNFFGAIYTSNNDGTTVNQNLYDNKSDVYLNGGPQGGGNGIPNGTYYFQVTNPNGSVLLSTDAASCRQLTVANNVVSGAAGPCPHANGILNLANMSTPVQLAPFDNTPNNGGEYKAWLIRQTSTTTVALDGKHLNFQLKDTKTDNFKVREVICSDCDSFTALRGRKFYDANANGIDNAEPGVAGVHIEVSIDGGAPATVTTDGSGEWTYPGVIVGSTYKVCEVLPTTGVTGFYWAQTAPEADGNGARCYSGTVVNDQPINGLDFGNVCFGPASGGKTLGFWSNKNGQAIMASDPNYQSDFTFLNALNLKCAGGKCPNGGDFDILPVTGGATTYTKTFRPWLLDGNAVNMAYMLSVQLAATSLDVKHGFLSDGQIVDATSLGLGYITIGSGRNAGNTELNQAGGDLTFTGNPLRDDEEILKNFLDNVNNSLLPFAQATPCPVVYPVPQP